MKPDRSFLPGAHLLIPMLLALVSASCTYLKFASIQTERARVQQVSPSQSTLRQLIDEDKFYLIGSTTSDDDSFAGLPLVIAAYSDRFRHHERVDLMHFQGNGTHFGLALPAGKYDLAVFADHNRDGRFAQNEVVGRHSVSLNNQSHPDGVLSNLQIRLGPATALPWAESIPVPEQSALPESLFYPAGAIRRLDDPVFDDGMATLGMYDPAAFLEAAPTMFYALEEDLSYKIPVVFVHGINGSPRSFAPLIERLDRDKYKPWLFYYPSGGDLDHQASFFYRLFLSGEVIRLNDFPMIVVAHSMGGLVVREALNRYKGSSRENNVKLLITIASPLGGHEAAASGEKHGPMVLPPWRDLNPQNRFIERLYREPLPKTIEHHLLYTFGNGDGMKFGENSDGVVSLASQLHRPAQQQSSAQFGFNAGHSSVLQHGPALDHTIQIIKTVKNPLPFEHLALLQQRGFEPPAESRFSPMTNYLIREGGHYLLALADGRISPLNDSQKALVQAIKEPDSSDNEVHRQLAQWVKQMRQ